MIFVNVIYNYYKWILQQIIHLNIVTGSLYNKKKSWIHPRVTQKVGVHLVSMKNERVPTKLFRNRYFSGLLPQFNILEVHRLDSSLGAMWQVTIFKQLFLWIFKWLLWQWVPVTKLSPDKNVTNFVFWHI